MGTAGTALVGSLRRREGKAGEHALRRKGLWGNRLEELGCCQQGPGGQLGPHPVTENP